MRLSSELPRRVVRVGIGLILVFPYLIWIARLPSWSIPEYKLWGPALWTSSWQALASAGLASLTGAALFAGAQAWRRPAAAELWLLLPNLVPPLFVGMAGLRLLTLFVPAPFGLPLVIAAHALINAGLVAVALGRLARARLGGQAEVALVLGARPATFWREIAWPQIRGDLAGVFLFVFALSFTSFSLPLMLGGPRAATLEVAIYDLVRVEGRWDAAVLLAFVQTCALLTLAFLLPRDFWPGRKAPGRLRLSAAPRLKALVPVPALLLLAGALRLSPPGAGTLEALAPAWLGTVALGLVVGLLHLLAFLAVAYASPHARLARFLNGYLAPSPAITGFGLLLVPFGPAALRLSLALTLFSFPLLYRWLVHAALARLRDQVMIARTLGASWSSILFDVVWPQAAGPILNACALAAVWAVGDFALSGILLDDGEATLPLLMQNYLNNYRFDQAAFLLAPLLGAALCVYLFFRGAQHYVAG